MKVINETTEFGLDMLRGLPRAYHSKINGEKHIVYVKENLLELYGLVTDNLKATQNFTPNNPSEFYNHQRPSFTLSGWTPPPLQEMFEGKVTFDKPTIVVNNRVSADLSESQIDECKKAYPNLDMSYNPLLTQYVKRKNGNHVSMNHYSMEFLTEVVRRFSDDYKIIYISPVVDKNYFKDDNHLLDLNDFEYIQENLPEVYTIKEHMEVTGKSYNICQMELEATSDKHLSTIGGNCTVSAYFGGDLVIYLGETWKYGSGVKYGIKRGERGIFKTNSWLKHLSGSNVVQLNTFSSILEWMDKNWKV